MSPPNQKTTPSQTRLIRVGDPVELASGGPTMTVERLFPKGGRVLCVWFNERGHVHRVMLPWRVLVLLLH